MINIGIYADYRFVSGTTPAGVSKHMRYMAKGLYADTRFNVSGIAACDQVSSMGDLSFLPNTTLPLSFKVSRELWSRINYPFIDRWCDGFDWVYCPNHDLVAKRKVKYAATFHGAPDLDSRFNWKQKVFDRVVSKRKLMCYQKIIQRADLIFVVSNWLKNHMNEQFGVAEERMVVVGNGVSEQFFAVGRCRLQGMDSTTNDSDEPYILAVGGLNYIDGGDYVVKLAQVMQRAKTNVRIKVAGSHNDADWTKAAVETGVVDLLQHVDESAVVKFMTGAKLLYMPSRYESFGMTAVEAMASGCPVVVSRATALPEVVGDCGVFVEPGKTSDVFDCIKDIVENGGNRELCQKAYERASSLYTWDMCVGRLASSLVARS